MPSLWRPQNAGLPTCTPHGPPNQATLPGCSRRRVSEPPGVANGSAPRKTCYLAGALTCLCLPAALSEASSASGVSGSQGSRGAGRGGLRAWKLLLGFQSSLRALRVREQSLVSDSSDNETPKPAALAGNRAGGKGHFRLDLSCWGHGRPPPELGYGTPLPRSSWFPGPKVPLRPRTLQSSTC